jgi:YaiO family outer membrane protein
MKRHLLFGPLLIALASSAHAAQFPNLKKITASVDGEFLSYSGPFGSRRIVNAETRVDTGDTTLSLIVSQGTRKAGGDKFSAARIAGTLTHDWSSRLSTRTYVSFASDKPVFVTRAVQQDVSYKPLSRTVLTVGGGYARYFGGVDSRSWSLGAAQYFRGAMVSYRFSSFNVHHLGNTTGHLLSVKLDDPYGSNQLWLGHGTALQDAVSLSTPQRGKYSNVELRRVQPIGGGIGLSVGVNRIWYETGSVKHRGTGVRVGLTFAKR